MPHKRCYLSTIISIKILPKNRLKNDIRVDVLFITSNSPSKLSSISSLNAPMRIVLNKSDNIRLFIQNQT